MVNFKKGKKLYYNKIVRIYMKHHRNIFIMYFINILQGTYINKIRIRSSVYIFPAYPIHDSLCILILYLGIIFMS